MNNSLNFLFKWLKDLMNNSLNFLFKWLKDLMNNSFLGRLLQFMNNSLNFLFKWLLQFMYNSFLGRLLQFMYNSFLGRLLQFMYKILLWLFIILSPFISKILNILLLKWSPFQYKLKPTEIFIREIFKDAKNFKIWLRWVYNHLELYQIIIYLTLTLTLAWPVICCVYIMIKIHKFTIKYIILVCDIIFLEAIPYNRIHFFYYILRWLFRFFFKYFIFLYGWHIFWEYTQAERWDNASKAIMVFFERLDFISIWTYRNVFIWYHWVLRIEINIWNWDWDPSYIPSIFYHLFFFRAYISVYSFFLKNISKLCFRPLFLIKYKYIIIRTKIFYQLLPGRVNYIFNWFYIYYLYIKVQCIVLYYTYVKVQCIILYIYIKRKLISLAVIAQIGILILIK
jgi:hypothetical protein